MVPKLGWPRAVFAGNALVIAVLFSFISVWYGYRRYTGPRARKTFLYFVLWLVAGGVVGTMVAMFESGRPLTSMTPEKILRTAGAVLATGGLLVAGFWTIAFLRGRDVKQRMALLQAEAERERLARQGMQAELKLLQAQVEPHFLFNTLANVRAAGADRAARRARDARPPDPLPARGAARDPRESSTLGARGRAGARLPRDHAHAHGRRARDRDRRAGRAVAARRSRR